MSARPSDLPSERDLHAMIDERLDRRRARELETWLTNEATRDERLGAWKRGLDAMRAAYDPIAEERPPLYLSLAARACVAQAERATQPAPPRVDPDERWTPRDVAIALASFLAGAVAALLLMAAARFFVDPSNPSPAQAAREAAATLWRMVVGWF